MKFLYCKSKASLILFKCSFNFSDYFKTRG